MFDWIKILSKSKPEPIEVYCPHCNKKMTVGEDVKYSCSDTNHKKTLAEEADKIKGNKHTDIFKTRPNCPYCLEERGYVEKGPDEVPYDFCLADYIKCSAKQRDQAGNAVDGCGESFPYQLLDKNFEIYRICIIGYTGSGKSVFTSRLKDEIAQNRKLKVLDCFPGNEFKKIKLIEGSYLPDKTEANNKPIQKDLYYLGFKKYPSTKKEKQVLLVIYDLGGEDFTQINNNLKQILPNIDAVFVALDFKRNESFADTIDKLFSIRNLITTESARKVKFAYIFTKADADLKTDLIEFNKQEIELQEEIGEENKEILIFSDKEGKAPVFSEYNEDCTGLCDATRIVKSLLKKDDNLLNDFENKKGEIISPKAFIVSALGFDSEVEEITEKVEEVQRQRTKLVKKGKAFRVLDPIWWLVFGGDK